MLVACALGHSVPARSQVVHGVVLQAGSNQPLQDVAVSLRTPDQKHVSNAVTTAEGVFWLQAPKIGTYQIVAQRIGYATSVSRPVVLKLSEQIEVSLALDIAPIQLDPVTVKARSFYDLGMLTGFYERMSLNEKRGIGRFITRDDIVERGPLDARGLFAVVPRVGVTNSVNRMPYVTFRGATYNECHPRVYLNGALANRGERAYIDELIRPDELEGVEIYQGLTDMPSEFYDGDGCGVILLWTRRVASDGPGRPFSWKRILFFTGAAAAVLFVVR
jgi:hypothetical protein